MGERMSKINDLEKKIKNLEDFKKNITYELNEAIADIFELKNPKGIFYIEEVICSTFSIPLAVEKGIYKYAHGGEVKDVEIFRYDVSVKNASENVVENFSEVDIYKEENFTFFKVHSNKKVYYYILNNKTEDVELANFESFPDNSKWSRIFIHSEDGGVDCEKE